MDVAAIEARWVSYGFLGGVNLESTSIGAILRKRLRIEGTTLRARSVEYKNELVSRFSEHVLPHFSSQQVKPIIDCAFAFDEIVQAHEYVASNANTGKVVLEWACA